jgi:hypothetical protein
MRLMGGGKRKGGTCGTNHFQRALVMALKSFESLLPCQSILAFMGTLKSSPYLRKGAALFAARIVVFCWRERRKRKLER